MFKSPEDVVITLRREKCLNKCKMILVCQLCPLRQQLPRGVAVGKEGQRLLSANL